MSATLAAIITAIVGMGLGIANSVTGAIYSSTSGKHIKKMINELQHQISKDQDLKNRLIDAYNAKDVASINATLQTIPGGFADRLAKAGKQLRDQVHKEKIEAIDNNITNNSSRLTALQEHQIDPYNQMTNAINTDWFDKNKHQLGATELSQTGPDNYMIKDQYGNTHKVTNKQMETWVYSKPNKIETVTNSKPQGIQTLKGNK